MSWRSLSLCLAVASFLVAIYFGWALHRISGPVLHEEMRADNLKWPRKWPYPDEWLWQWEDQLAAENPPPPNSIPIHGELPRMEMKLRGWIVVSGLVGACLVLLGFRLVPYISFTVSTAEPLAKVVERLSAWINSRKQICPPDQVYFQGRVWDSGFKVTKLHMSPGNCPIVVRGRFKPSSDEGVVEIDVSARLFRPLSWFLFTWFGALAVAIACLIAMFESDKSGWFPTNGDLLDALYGLVGIALLSWVAIVAWFRFGGRKTLEEITQFLTPA